MPDVSKVIGVEAGDISKIGGVEIGDITKLGGQTVSTFSNTYSMDFDGADEYFNCNTGNIGNVDFSMSWWIKTDATGSWAGMWSVGCEARGSANSSFGRLYFVAANLKVAAGSDYGSTTLNDGNWHHIVETFTASTKVKNIYVDGNTTPEATVSLPVWWNLPTYYFTEVVIGKYNAVTTSFVYEGLMDEVAYWNSVLSTSNVTTLYNSGVPGDISSLSPVGWWRMGENGTYSSGWTLTDQGSGGNDATSVNIEEADRKEDVAS